jgi:hypothetical protein
MLSILFQKQLICAKELIVNYLSLYSVRIVCRNTQKYSEFICIKFLTDI